MKNFWKLFIAFSLILFAYSNHEESLAVQAPKPVQSTIILRSESDPIAKNCPDPGDRSLISICGNVRQALPAEQILAGGDTAPHVSQVPVQGVSVYLYECDNSSPTCKRDGLLVHPFSSTSTNEDGNFHLVARKTENSWWMEREVFSTSTNKVVKRSDEIINQSKKRYLVFRCNDTFQGIHIIPSYLDLTNIVHEVNCPNPPYTYTPPLMQFDFIGGVKLAGNMGIDDNDYPTQAPKTSTDDGYHVAQQAIYEQYARKTSLSSKIKLTGADPRFTAPDNDPPRAKNYLTLTGINDESVKMAALERASSEAGLLELGEFVPTQGAWWSLDCVKKYEGTKWESLCANHNPNENVDIAEYEKSLYENAEYTIQNLLPNIPPKYSVLYYRPLEIRQEISAYYQDHDDIAKFMGMEFSNCVGAVYKREWLTDKDPPKYPNCEALRECNETLNTNGGWVNSFTTGGPAQGLASPLQYRQLIDEMDPDIPVCLIENEPEPVKLGEIQMPGAICEDGVHRLCEGGAYWNNYFITNLGRNNVTTKWGLGNENTDDSYFGSGTNEKIFLAGSEADGVPIKQGVSAIASSEREANMSGWDVIVGEDISSTENLTDFLSQPFKDSLLEKEISDGDNYLVSTRPVAWGQFSDINEKEEMMVNKKDDDAKIFDNYAMDMEMSYPEANDNHYPTKDLDNLATVVAEAGEKGGTRTPTQGLYFTTASLNRINSLTSRSDIFGFQRNALDSIDSLDSSISIGSGQGYINWAWENQEESQGNSWDWFTRLINLIFGNIFNLVKERTEDKSFSDKTPEGLDPEPEKVDSLVAKGFEVNEQNFKDLFPLPCSGFNMCDWGIDQKCYPWNKVEHGEECGTYKDEPECDGGGSGKNQEVSRTCRVDTCRKIVFSGQCTCTRTVDPATGNYNYGEPSCPTNVIGVDSGTACDTEGERLTCAQKQVSCYKEGDMTATTSCLNDHYDISGLMAASASCGSGNFSGTSNTGSVDGSTIIPACLMSRAGPNVCDGDIERNTTLKVKEETTDNDGTGSDIDKVSADAVPEAGLELYKSLRDPFTNDISPKPASWISVQSSISNIEPDLSQRKDNVGIGTGTNFLTRAQFGQPQSFGTINDLEPLYIHCQNKNLRTAGGWKYGDIEYILEDDGRGNRKIITESYTDCVNKCDSMCHWECDEICDSYCFDNCKNPCVVKCGEKFFGIGKTCEYEAVPDPEVLEMEDLTENLTEITRKDNNVCQSNFSDSCQMEFLGSSSVVDAYGGLSDTFKLIMNLAGETFDIEPAAMMVYMKRIMNNTGIDYSYYWSKAGEEDLKKASLPWYGGLEFCDDLEPTAQHPYDWILLWFSDEVLGGSDGALDNLATGRSRTASRCNFLDSTYTTAIALKTRGVDADCEKQIWGGPREADGKYVAGSIANAVNSLVFGDDAVGVFATDDQLQKYMEVWNKCKD